MATDGHVISPLFLPGGDIGRPTRLICMSCATRGGLATALYEIARKSQVGMNLVETDIPVLPQVEAACELLGPDPLYLGHAAQRIGTVIDDANGFVHMATRFDSRVVDWLSGEPLQR